ncbi:MAG: hypothetical protein SWK76_10670 [Actinomycetota bacterium]|nr:hypothetical protein [Actinomycetota bacterium]
MRVKSHSSVLLVKGGRECPLCGMRMTTRDLICSRCRRSGRFSLDREEIGARSKEPFLPRQLMR